MNNEPSNNSALQSESYPKLQPIFMGFTLQIQNIENQVRSNLADARYEILEAVAQIIPGSEFDAKASSHYSWDDLNPDLIEITISPGWSVAQAWDLTYKLRQLDKVIYVEPRFALQVPTGTRSSPESDSPDTERGRNPEREKAIEEVLKNPEWHLEQMKIRQAWALIESKNKRPGEGIVIAHPDTGFLPHPEISEQAIYGNGSSGNDYLETKGPLLSEAEIVAIVSRSASRKFPVNSWHGTATASLIVSPEGKQQANGKDKRYVTGVAPGVTLKRYYLGPTTLTEFEFFVPGLAKAINDAAKDPNVRVISISFGGYPVLSLRRAIINAQRAGIIVVASAGNSIPFAIWPSTYTDVISVASSAYGGATLAAHSARGSRIDVAAPGDLVMVAVPTLDKDNNLVYTAEPRSGTSYAAPLVAGVAALWLSYHGWDELLKKYKIPARIPLVFDKLLRETCELPEDWNKKRWGSGIVNAYNLLNAQLPDLDDPYIQEALAYRETDHIQLDMGGVSTFAYLFEEVLSERTVLRGISNKMIEFFDQDIDIPQWAFGQVFGRGSKELRQYLRTFGREIAFYLATDFTLYRRMENVLKSLADLSFGNFGDNLRGVLSELRVRASDHLKEYIKY